VIGNAASGFFEIFNQKIPTFEAFIQKMPKDWIQYVAVVLFILIAASLLKPFFRRYGKIELPEGAIVLVEGPVGSGKDEFCLELMKGNLKKGKIGAIFSYLPEKEREWFMDWEKDGLLFVKVEADINDMAISISKGLEGGPNFAYFNVLNQLLPKYTSEELTDFLSSTFSKLVKAGCGAVFITEKEIASPQVLSAIESLFEGVIEFQVQEEGGKLGSYFRVREFKLKKFDTNWRRFK
jgi:hypothetical protein